MIRTYNNVLNEQLTKNIVEYFKSILESNVWGSNIGWDQNLSLMSSNILTHRIINNSLKTEIKNSIEKALDINFEKKQLILDSSIYVWTGGSYITWHSDDCYHYNGTIYLNEKWDSDDGGVFLYKDNQTKEIKGIEPTYNTMIVNYATESDPHNAHCVTCIVPGTIKKRITIQWRTHKIDKTKKNSIKYQ